MSRITPEQRATYAKQIAENPIWDDLIEDFKYQLYLDFCAYPDMQSRERIAMASDMIDELVTKMLAYIADGTPLKIVGDNNGN